MVPGAHWCRLQRCRALSHIDGLFLFGFLQPENVFTVFYKRESCQEQVLRLAGVSHCYAGDLNIGDRMALGSALLAGLRRLNQDSASDARAQCAASIGFNGPAMWRDHG